MSIRTKFKFNQTLIKNKTLAPNIKPTGLILQVPTYNKNITMNLKNQFTCKPVNLLLDDMYRQLKYLPSL